MFKKTKILIVVLLVVAGGGIIPEANAWDPKGKYRDLNIMDVKNNVYKIRSQRKCIGCFLVDAYLVRANLRGVNLRAANLTRAKLMYASLYGADLSKATLDGADFSGAQWIDGKICKSGSIGGCISTDSSPK